MLIGSLLGSTSPVTTYSPLLGAELTLSAGTSLQVPVDPSYELGVLVDHGSLTVDAKPLAAHELGGPPFGEPIVRWWNFIGREHEEVVAHRAEWESLHQVAARSRARPKLRG